MINLNTVFPNRESGFARIEAHRGFVAGQIVHQIETTSGGIVVIISGMKGGKSTALNLVTNQLRSRGHQVSLAKAAFIRADGITLSDDSNIHIRRSEIPGDEFTLPARMLHDWNDVEAIVARLKAESTGGKTIIGGDEMMLIQSPGNEKYSYPQLQEDILNYPWAEEGVHLVVTGLDYYHDGKLWQSTWELMKRAIGVYQLYALCEGGDRNCLRPATRTQRMLNDVPWLDGPAVVVRADGEECDPAMTAEYIAVCEQCHVEP